MGFWLPDKCVGFYSPVPEGQNEEQIFYFKVLCVPPLVKGCGPTHEGFWLESRAQDARALDPCLGHGARCTWPFLRHGSQLAGGKPPGPPQYTSLIPVSVHMFHPNPQVYF